MAFIYLGFSFFIEILQIFSQLIFTWIRVFLFPLTIFKREKEREGGREPGGGGLSKVFVFISSVLFFCFHLFVW